MSFITEKLWQDFSLSLRLKTLCVSSPQLRGNNPCVLLAEQGRGKNFIVYKPNIGKQNHPENLDNLLQRYRKVVARVRLISVPACQCLDAALHTAERENKPLNVCFIVIFCLVLLSQILPLS